MIYGGIFDLDAQKSRLKELEQKSQDSSTWKDHQKLNRLAKEKTSIEKILIEWTALDEKLEESAILIALLEEEPNDQAFSELKKEYFELTEQLRALELKHLLNGPHDKNNCYVSIHAGAGGTEAADWAQILQRMYFKWAEQKKFAVDILFVSESEEAGIRSTSFLVKGIFAYGYLQSETGVHRLVRISPFDANSRRHTSFASVFSWPELEDNIKVEIKEEDLRVDTYRASGAGGQHVNKTNSAIRITHLPTNVVVQCQNQRSQHSNRHQAMKMLKAALYNKEEEKRKKEKQSVESSKKANEWGSQIRSYILHPYQMAKDHRTQLEIRDVESVLNGHLDPLISTWLKTKEE